MTGVNRGLTDDLSGLKLSFMIVLNAYQVLWSLAKVSTTSRCLLGYGLDVGPCTVSVLRQPTCVYVRAAVWCMRWGYHSACTAARVSQFGQL